MRYILVILLLTSSLIVKSQARDTIFLKRTLVDTPYHFYNAIYIDTIDRLDNHKYITDFSFNSFDSITYYRDLARFKPLKKIKNIPVDLPMRWILLYKYKDEYYTYVPSEAGENYKFEITDSTTIDFTMEGPEPSKIKKIRRLTATQFIINRKNFWQGNKAKVNIIDPSRGIAVFTFNPKYLKKEQKILMVSVDKASRFKTIINLCETDKVAEFEFDKIDFSKLK